jgi:hypothetical protein
LRYFPFATRHPFRRPLLYRWPLQPRSHRSFTLTPHQIRKAANGRG